MVELLVVISIIALLMAVLLPALAKARTQAKRIVCLSGMRQLALAWTAYAENNDGKLVNGGQAMQNPAPNTPTELCWCTSFNTTADPGYDWSWVINGYDGYSGPPLTYNQRVEKLKKGALFRYCQNVKSYRCPEADKDMHRTYEIPSSMNGLWKPATAGYCPEALVIKRLGQIKKSSERVVFVEQKRIAPDAFQVPVPDPDKIATFTWTFDKPNVMHGNGANFGFTDGHAEYHIWATVPVLRWAKTVDNDQSKGAPIAGEIPSYLDDLKWLINAVWGVAR